MSIVRAPDLARATDKFTAEVVLPTPPFWLVMHRIRDTVSLSSTAWTK